MGHNVCQQIEYGACPIALIVSFGLTIVQINQSFVFELRTAAIGNGKLAMLIDLGNQQD
jgi:hypothetical protein